MNHVKKRPAPDTLAEVRGYADGEEPGLPEGFVVMSNDELAAWIDEEKAMGWEPVRPDPIPASVTPWQMRRALNQLGLRAAVEAAVASADQDTKDGWDYALEIRRDNPLIAGMGAALGMTEAQLDDLFRLAATFQ